MDKSTAKESLFNIPRKVAMWVKKEKEELKSKFETRFIKTVRTAVILAALLTLINVIVVLKG
jgi:hypothetical protein